MSSDHDNGVVGSNASTPKKRHVKGISTKKLKLALSKTLVRLEKTRKENVKLTRSLARANTKNGRFCDRKTSTMCEEPNSESETQKFVNQVSLSTLNIPECKPEAGEAEINKRAYDHWKKVLSASLDLIRAEDEKTRNDVFRIKAGPLLLELLEGTSTQPDMPDETVLPYSNAIARLDGYFGSRAYILSQRSKLANMVQQPTEQNIEYVKRVAAASKQCNYKPDEEFEAISRTITRGSTDSRVRSIAYRVLTEEKTLNDLIDRVRIREVELQNENDYRRLHHQNAATVAAVSRSNGYEQQRRGYSGAARGYNSSRGRGGSARGPVRNMKSSQACWRCLSPYHGPAECFHIEKVCRSCDRRGHLARACSTKVKQESMKRPRKDDDTEPPRKIAAIMKNEEDAEPTKVPITEKVKSIVHHVESCAPGEKTAYVKAYVAGVEVLFFVDSGAQVNTITQQAFDAIMRDGDAKQNLHELKYGADKVLRAYATQGNIDVVATFSAELFVSEDRPVLVEKFYVVRESRALLGFNTATRYSLLVVGLDVPIGECVDPDWRCEFASVNSVTGNCKSEFPRFNIPPVLLSYNSTMPPSRNVYTNIPAAFREMTKRKLAELEEAGIIERVTEGMGKSFCSSLLVIPKGNSDIRVVVDLRGPNRCIYRTPFKMPTFEDILLLLHDMEYISTIDMTMAFFHIVLDERCRHLTNFFGGDALYRCCRLPFGLTNAPDIFQEVMETEILAGCEGAISYLDDVLVWGKTKDEHDRNLQKVFQRFNEHNVKINQAKCAFGKREVRFLGFKLSTRGWQVEEEKVSAIKKARAPESQAEVKSFLGLVTFVEKFIPQRADKTHLLRELAQASNFYWNQELEDEFNYLKKTAWRSIKTLGYFKREDVTELYVDASPHGLGAILVQYDAESKPRIIACASKALSQSEKKYPQTQKEALAMVWGVERFSTYLLNVVFTIWTDAESNEFIFGGQHRIGKRAVSRAEAWALRLLPYQFKVKRVPGETNVADALSRLVSESQSEDAFDESAEKHLLYFLDTGTMEFTWNDIEVEAEIDAEQILLRAAMQRGCWDRQLRKYESESKNLRVMGALIFHKDRVVLPFSMRNKAISQAHQGHMGAASMKKILRNYFWWPGMAKQAETFVEGCETCFRLSRKNPPIPLATRELPEGPWEVLQIDFFDFKGCGFIVVVDTYSRYLHVIELKSKDASSTNEALCKIFEVWGYPLTIHSDNGPPFLSENFVKIWEDRGVRIRKGIAGSAQSNGAVERQNKGLKEILTAAQIDNVNWRKALQKYLHMHNKVRPLSRLGVTPFELLVGWRFRGTFPFLWESKPSNALDRTEIREKDASSKLVSKQYADLTRGAKDSDLAVGDRVVLAQNSKHKGDPMFSLERYTVIARDGAKVIAQSDRGVQYSRNVQEWKKVPIALQTAENQDDNTDEEATVEDIDIPSSSTVQFPDLVEEPVSDNVGENSEKSKRPKRSSKKPSRFNDMVLFTIFS